jgi:hypothetical protein
MMDELKTLLKKNPHVDICFNSNGFKVGAKNTDMKYWRRFDWKLLDADRIERAIEKVKKPSNLSLSSLPSSRAPRSIPGPESSDEIQGFKLMEFDDDEMAMGASVKRRSRRSTHRRRSKRSTHKKSSRSQSKHRRHSKRRSTRRRRR